MVRFNLREILPADTEDTGSRSFRFFGSIGTRMKPHGIFLFRAGILLFLRDAAFRHLLEYTQKTCKRSAKLEGA